MKKALRAAAALIVGFALIAWFAGGANGGWTRTSAEVRTVDEVTGLDQVEWRPTFVPGIDFVALALLTASALAGGSFLFRRKKTGNPNKPG